MKNHTLQVDPINCRAHGLCAEELPEAISLDEWGYPIVPAGPVPRELVRRAKAAAAACPVLALRLTSAPSTKEGAQNTRLRWKPPGWAKDGDGQVSRPALRRLFPRRAHLRDARSVIPATQRIHRSVPDDARRSPTLSDPPTAGPTVREWPRSRTLESRMPRCDLACASAYSRC
jgi:ferredoxin